MLLDRLNETEPVETYAHRQDSPWSITFLYYNGTKFLLQREIDASDAVTEPPLPFAKCLSASRRYSMEYPRLPPLLG